jgi:quercetin dioxygenase-like cupin family protein
VTEYEVAHLDELERLPGLEGAVRWQPVRRRFGIEAFGANVWSNDAEGGLLIEDHFERDGHEELYVVLRGRARFTLGEGEDVDAPAGTFVFVRPGTRRTAVAREPDTAVLAVGAKKGEVFQPSGWEWASVAFGLLRNEKPDEGRRVMLEGVDKYRDHWAGHYNLACYEARTGRTDEAIEALRRSAELDAEQARKYAASDSDFEPLRDDPRFQELVHG